jgi:hypothetical protein
MRHNRAIKKLITRIGGFRPFLDRETSEEAEDESDEIVTPDDSSEDE